MDMLKIEEDIPLSRSCLWQVQRDFFSEQGVEAWRDVPFFVTSNPFIADRYARMMIAYLQDLARLNLLCIDEPIYCLELGTGTGQFSFYCQQALTRYWQATPELTNFSFCYVMTDFTASNLEFWQKQACFQKGFADGSLDYALFDLEHPAPLPLQQSQKTLSSLKNPLIVIGNYIFDSIRQDFFRCHHGQLQACHINTLAPAQQYDTVSQTLQSLENIGFEYVYHNVAPNDYSTDLANILSLYAQKMHEAAFTLPTHGIESLAFMQRLAPAGFCLLTSDKGYHALAEFPKQLPRNLVFHGSFSFDVNFHALKEYVQNQGGQAFLQSYREGIKTNILTSNHEPLPHLQTAFNSSCEDFGPADYFRYHSHFKKLEPLNLELLLSQLRLGQYDPYVFSLYLTPLCEIIKTATGELQAAYLESLPQFFAHIYPLPMGRDHYFSLGYFAHTLSCYALAEDYYHISLTHYGERFDTLFNLGLSTFAQEKYSLAQGYFTRALPLTDSPEGTQNWLDKIKQLDSNH